MAQSSALEDKYIGCLVGGAVGDALGFTTENMSRERIKRKFGTLRDYKVRPTWGYYTDDTQLTIAVAETLLEGPGFDPQRFRRKLARWWLVIPRLSGRSTKNAALKCLLGYKETGRHVPGSSGAMRAAPLGLFYHDREHDLFEMTVACCRITHTHPSAIAGALVVSFSVAYCLRHETLDTQDYLAKIAQVAAEFDPEMGKGLRALEGMLGLPQETVLAELLKHSRVFGSPITDIMLTSVYGFIKYARDFEQSVILCANAGWDTDTMAAINGNIAGAFNGFSALPARLVARLERGYKGRDYLIELARHLYAQTPLAPRGGLRDYLSDLGRNTRFIFNMVLRKPKL